MGSMRRNELLEVRGASGWLRGSLWSPLTCSRRAGAECPSLSPHEKVPAQAAAALPPCAAHPPYRTKANASPDSKPAKVYGLAHPLPKFTLKIFLLSSKENVMPKPRKSWHGSDLGKREVIKFLMSCWALSPVGNTALSWDVMQCLHSRKWTSKVLFTPMPWGNCAAKHFSLPLPGL